MIWTGPTLEDAEAEFLDGPCIAVLGDSIQYAANGTAFVPLRAFVDYADALRSIETGAVIEQNIAIQALKSDIPVKPNSTARIRLARAPGLIFKPIIIQNDPSGSFWNFEVQKVG